MKRSSKHLTGLAVAVLVLIAVGRVNALEPVLVKNLDFGAGSSSPCEFVTVNGVQLFAAADSSGRELWKTDGTYLGTQEVKDIFNSGSNSGNPFGFFFYDSPTLGEIAFFTARDSSTGQELWRSDGTTAGTQRVADLNMGSGSSNPSNYVYVAAQDKVYFRAFDGISSRLFQTDGVSATPLTTLHLNGGVGAVAELGGNLFVSAVDPVGGFIELIRVELPSGAWAVVADINATADGSAPSGMTTIGGLIYMSAYTPATGREPYVTNGTIGNLVSLGEFRAGAQNGFVDHFTPFGGWVYFGSGAGLARTQGTLATTSVVFPALSAGGPLIDTGSLLYAPITVIGLGSEPYVTDGTSVALVEDVRPGPVGSFTTFNAAAIDGRLVFSADDGVHGVEPWESTDGTPAGTDILADIEPGGTSSNAECFRPFPSYGLMRATQAPLGNELFALVPTAHDFGDAPDSYGTALVNDGPRHVIVDGFHLGSGVDGELNRPYDQGGLADDYEWTDDEDGVVFQVMNSSSGLLGLGETAALDVTASLAGILDAWVDFNIDGDFADAGEKLTFTDGGGASLAAGSNAKTFPVPASATPGQSYARFRFTSTGIADPTGLAADGEVEDHRVVLAALDFGDASDTSYATLRTSDGARHAIVQGPRLGSSIDADSDGQPTSDATGDDTDGSDDEDGVTVPLLVPNQDVTVVVQVVSSFVEGAEEGGGGPGSLNAWVDYNQDGDWADAGEHVFQDQGLNTGTNNLQLSVPGTASLGLTLARFRVSNTTGLDSTGLAGDGEVEDYQVTIGSLDADLAITKTDGQTTAVPGEELVYTIVASNPSGPSDAFASAVTDSFAADLTNCDVTCEATGGGSCTAEEVADQEDGKPVLEIDQTVDLPVGGSVTFTVTCTIDPAATGSLSNTASVAVPAGMTDPTPGDNTATDVDTLVPTGDLTISKTDGVPWVIPPASLTYTILADNPGPSDALGVGVSDSFPAELDNVSWTCVGSSGGVCAASGSGDIAESVDLPAGAAVTFTAITDVVATPPAEVSNTATLATPAGFEDPDTGNNAATDVTAVVSGTDIFSDGFESGDTSAWSASQGGFSGVLALEEATDRLDVSVQLHSEALERTGRRRTGILSGQSVAGEVVFRVELETRAAEFRFVSRLLDSSGQWVEGYGQWMDVVPDQVRLTWRRSLARAADGSLLVHQGRTLLAGVEAVVTFGGDLRRVQSHVARGRTLVRWVEHPDWLAVGGDATRRP